MSDEKKKKKKGFFDFLKNSNVKKLEKQGKDQYGRHTDPDARYKQKAKKEFKEYTDKFKGYADSGLAKKAKESRAKQNALLIIIGSGSKKR